MAEGAVKQRPDVRQEIGPGGRIVELVVEPVVLQELDLLAVPQIHPFRHEFRPAHCDRAARGEISFRWLRRRDATRPNTLIFNPKRLRFAQLP